MSDLQATVELSVELFKFYNVDLFQRGFYQVRTCLRASPRVPVQVEAFLPDMAPPGGVPPGGACLLGGAVGASRTFQILYRNEEIALRDVVMYRAHLLVDSRHILESLKRAEFVLIVELWFGEGPPGISVGSGMSSNGTPLGLVSSRTLTLTLSPTRGLHHHTPILFDYFHLAAVGITLHSTLVALHQPHINTPRSSKPWIAKGPPVANNCVSGGNSPSFQAVLLSTGKCGGQAAKTAYARQMHQEVCTLLLAALEALRSTTAEYQALLPHLRTADTTADGIHRLRRAADLAKIVEGEDDFVARASRAVAQLCAECTIQWRKLLSAARPLAVQQQLAARHHDLRVRRFAEAFFVQVWPRRLAASPAGSAIPSVESRDSRLALAELARTRYLTALVPLPAHCAALDGEPATMPIIFEDRYEGAAGDSRRNSTAPAVVGRINAADCSCGISAILDATRNPCSATLLGALLQPRIILDDGVLRANLSIAAPRVPNIIQPLNGEIVSPEHPLIGNHLLSRHSASTLLDITPPKYVHRQEAPGSASTLPARHSKSLDHLRCAPPAVNCVSNGLVNGAVNGIGHGVPNVGGATLPRARTHTTSESERQWVLLQTSAGQCMATLPRHSHPPRNSYPPGRAKGVVEGPTRRQIPRSCSTQVLRNGNWEGHVPVRTRKTLCRRAHPVGTETLTSSSDSDSPTQRRLLASASVPFSLEALEVSRTPVRHNANSTAFSESLPNLAPNLPPPSAFGGSESTSSLSEQSGWVSSGSAPSSPEIRTRVNPQPDPQCFNTLQNGATYADPRVLNGEQLRIKLQALAAATAMTNGWVTDGHHKHAGTWSEAVRYPGTRHKNKHSYAHAAAKSKSHLDLTVNIGNPYEEVRLPPPQQFRDVPLPPDEFRDPPRNPEPPAPPEPIDNPLYHVYEAVTSATRARNARPICKSKSSNELTAVTVTPSSKNLSRKTSSRRSSSHSTSEEPQAVASQLLKRSRDEFKRLSDFPGAIYADLGPVFASTAPYFSVSDECRLFSVGSSGGSGGLHLVVCVHGLDGNCADLRLVKTYLELGLPGAPLEFLMSDRNQGDTFSDFDTMTDRLVGEVLCHIAALGSPPARISFVAHSLGTIIVRSALSRPRMRPLLSRLHTFLSLSGPHLGTLYNSSGLVNMGMWFMQKWKRSGSLLQLCLRDAADPRECFLYRLAQRSALHHFRHVLLCGSSQDRYVPLHSSRLELPKAAARDSSPLGVAYREMAHNLVAPLAVRRGITLARFDAHHALPHTANALIGRAAHIAVLDSELFLEKFLLVVGLKYFH